VIVEAGLREESLRKFTGLDLRGGIGNQVGA